MGRARIPYVTASVADGLRRLVDLREQGVLTGEEFEAAKSGVFPVSPIWFRGELRKLTDLREEGVLTEEEFEVAKTYVTAMPTESMNIPAGDSHVVYIIPPHMVEPIIVKGTSQQRERALRQS